MGFPVIDTVANSLRVTRNIMDKIMEAAKMTFEASKVASERLQWLTAFIFDKLKWIPVATLLSIVTILFRHPLEFLTRVLCAIVISILFVFYIILTIPPFSWLAFGVWFFVTRVIVLVGTTLLSLIIFSIVGFIFVILALINEGTGGALNKIALCQTSPFAWFTVPNYQDGNKYNRMLFCNTPCMTGYTPDELTGEFCNRTPLAQPSFCPQAEVMRLLLKKNTSGERHVYANYLMTPSYLIDTPKGKEEKYIKHFQQMQMFFDKCNRKLGNFNNIALDICGSLDAIKEQKMNFLSDDIIKKLKEVCKQGFCNSRSRHVFCSSFAESKPEEQGNGLIKAIISMLTAIILFLFLIVMTYKFVSAATK